MKYNVKFQADDKQNLVNMTVNADSINDALTSVQNHFNVTEVRLIKLLDKTEQIKLVENETSKEQTQTNPKASKKDN